MISNRMGKGGRLTVMDDFRQLLSEISHCSVADAIRSGSSPVAVPCHKIVGLQTGSLFQLPEPWSGQIDIARLLFISSNPSINELEEYPEKSWELHRTTDFSIIDSPRLLAGLLTDARFCGMVSGALRYNSGVRLVIEQPRYCKRGGMRSSRESISHLQKSCIANRRKNGVLQRPYTSVPIATWKEFCPSQQREF